MPVDTANAECDVFTRLKASPEIFRMIAEWSGTELQLQHRLRSAYADDLVRGALTLSELRKKGTEKFSRAAAMWFDRVGFEQSTAECVARHKSRRFHGRTWDYCCGIGADAVMLAERGEVIAVDRRSIACLCTRWNADAYGVGDRVVTLCADVESLSDRSGLVHVDPDRRSTGRPGRGRSLRIEEGTPGLEFLRRLVDEFRGGAIKVSPAANFIGKFPTAEIELVSLDGECKEATIWFGELAEPGLWRATVLPAEETIAGDPLGAVAATAPLGRYLFDPDPAVVRSGLVDAAALRAGLSRLDDEEEYLTADAAVPTPFARAFEVLAELPNNSREIRAHFRDSGVGRLEIKCRRIPVDAAAVRRKLSLSGAGSAVLIFARIGGRARAVVCRRVAADGEATARRLFETPPCR